MKLHLCMKTDQLFFLWGTFRDSWVFLILNLLDFHSSYIINNVGM